MSGRFETVGAADLALQGGDRGRDELDHPAAAPTDQVIVPLTVVLVLVHCLSTTEHLFADEPAVDQDVEVPVDRGTGDLGSPFAQ